MVLQEDSLLVIHKNALEDWGYGLDYEFEWWPWGEMFIYSQDREWTQWYLDGLRAERKVMKIFGATALFVCCLETKSDIVRFLAQQGATWDKITQTAKPTFGDKWVNIPKFINSDAFKNLPEKIERAPYELGEFLSEGNDIEDYPFDTPDYYAIYYDGFRPIKDLK